jgi:hypothetical protein
MVGFLSCFAFIVQREEGMQSRKAATSLGGLAQQYNFKRTIKKIK